MSKDEGSGGIPEYLENFHTTMINSTLAAIPTAIALNPFTAAVPYDPTTDLGLAWDAVCEFDAFVDALSHEADWSSAMSTAETVVDTIIDDTYINADIVAFAETLDGEMDASVFPQFKAGMRNMNAVMTSAFVLGEADIYSRRTKEVTKYGTDLRQRMHLQRNDMIAKGVDRMLINLMSTAQWEGEVARVSVEAKKQAIIAQSEYVIKGFEMQTKSATWELEMWKYGANMLGAFAGGGNLGEPGMSQFQSTLSGALGGATVGAEFGGFGAVVGGIAGGIGGFLQ